MNFILIDETNTSYVLHEREAYVTYENEYEDIVYCGLRSLIHSLSTLCDNEFMEWFSENEEMLFDLAIDINEYDVLEVDEEIYNNQMLLDQPIELLSGIFVIKNEIIELMNRIITCYYAFTCEC